MKLEKPEFFPFIEAENDTLQVLLKNLEITRNGDASKLSVNFNHTTPTIRRRESRLILKRLMQASMDDFTGTCAAMQQQIDAVLIDQTSDSFRVDGESILFRYCSGGTLPILAIEGIDYYCLFLRDIAPYGWNIANGSTDTLPELLDPSITIRRELREELIAVDPSRLVDYTFVWDTEPTVNRPEFDDARRMIANLEGFAGISEFERVPRVVHTCDGYDSIDATFWNASNEAFRAPKAVRGCFLTVTAEDFGIEVDHIGRVELPKGVRLLDGELNSNCLLNRVIGLFNVNTFRLDPPVRPDVIFHSGESMSLEEAVRHFRDHVLRHGLRGTQHMDEWHVLNKEQKYRLCPVTRQIIARHQRYLHQPRPGYVHEQSMLAFMFDVCSRGGQIFRPTQFFDFGIDGEIEWVTSEGVITGKRIYVQLKSGPSHLRQHGDNSEVFGIRNQRHVQYWRDQDSDVYLVVRSNSYGAVRWMNITKALKACASTVVEFTGEELDVRSLLKTRDKCLGQDLAHTRAPQPEHYSQD
ncbi:MAG: DUF4365 domain-containing protein [Candidatus Hydrogenedentes bacterium]|nr:DUF4365 domain-containing protein [Candidatus Hydrogenedentota bacterium]